jgi:hypothetical protein
MPSASKQQQKLMGIVRALQKGDIEPSKVSKKAKEMAKSMDPKDVKDFASTKHKGLPKKVKKEDYNPTKMYVVRKAIDNLDASGLVMELNPLEGIQPLNLMQDDVHSIVHDESEAQRIAAEVYDAYTKEVQALEEKKGKVGDKLKKTIDHLEKKRKEHLDMAKQNPKNASQYKNDIAKIATQIDDLMSKMERIEKSKKNLDSAEDDKKPIKENKDKYTIGDKIVGSNKVYFIYNNDTGTQSGSYKTKEEAQKELNKKKDKLEERMNPTDKVSLDVPLFIRLLEYAREDAKTDMDLHNVAEKAITLSQSGMTLSMTDYETIVGGQEKIAEAENVVDSIPEIQRYLKDLATKIPTVKGIDTNEVKGIVELVNAIINKLGKGSIGPAIKATSQVFNQRTQGLK